jgi:hypothetical protein
MCRRRWTCVNLTDSSPIHVSGLRLGKRPNPILLEAPTPPIAIATSSILTMSQFRAKRLDIGGFVNKWVIKDHTKRKVFAEYETERFVNTYSKTIQTSVANTATFLDKLSATQYAIPLSRHECVRKHSSSSHRCTATHGRHRSRIDV